MTQVDAGLLACPFCGGEAQQYDIDLDNPLDANDGGSGIECKQCHATTALHFERKENLVSSWNDRAPPPEAGVRELADRVSIYVVEGDEQFVHFATHGEIIVRVPASSAKGVALLKLDAVRRSSPPPTAGREIAVWEAVAANVIERLGEDDGIWVTCSGCYETEDGYPNGHYPHSSVFGCTLGGGCSECGGIGAIWDTTDYAAMGEELSQEILTPSPDVIESVPPPVSEAISEQAFKTAEILEADEPLTDDMRTFLAKQLRKALAYIPAPVSEASLSFICPKCGTRGITDGNASTVSEASREALRQIEQMPFSAVNDSESLRHTIKTMQHLARAALAKSFDNAEGGGS